MIAIRHLLLAAIGGLVAVTTPAVPAAPAPNAAQPLAIGETFTLESKVLGETRRINVYLPPGYAKSDTKLPVLYMPDGGLAEDFVHIAGLVQVSVGNETMRPFILVGIENTERRRDMTGPTDNANCSLLVDQLCRRILSRRRSLFLWLRALPRFESPWTPRSG